jgi:hypothetical protein
MALQSESLSSLITLTLTLSHQACLPVGKEEGKKK